MGVGVLCFTTGLSEELAPLIETYKREVAHAEPVGAQALEDFALGVYGDDDPLATPEGEGPLTFSRTSSGAILRIALEGGANTVYIDRPYTDFDYRSDH